MRVLQHIARLRREKNGGSHQTHLGEGAEQSAAVPPRGDEADSIEATRRK
jgi:hypothetical protein